MGRLNSADKGRVAGAQGDGERSPTEGELDVNGYLLVLCTLMNSRSSSW